MSYQVPNEVSSAEAREHFTDIVDAASFKGRRIVLKRNKKRMCAIVPIEDLELLEKVECETEPQDT